MSPRVLIYTDATPGVSETFIVDHFFNTTLPKFFVARIPANTPVSYHREFGSSESHHATLYDRRPSLSENLRFAAGFHQGLRHIVAEFKPTIVHVHYLTNVPFILPYLVNGEKIVVTAHGFDVTVKANSLIRTLGGLQFLLNRHRIKSNVTLCLAVSDFIRQQLSNLGFPKDKVKRHYLGIPIDLHPQLAIDRPRKRMIFCGRLVEKKGTIFMLEALNELNGTGLSVPTRVIGDGPERRRLEQFARERRLDVEFVGAVDRSNLAQYFEDAAFLCFPSSSSKTGDNEGLPLVCLEAQCRGLAVIGFDQGPMAEAVLKDKTGLLVQDRNITELASAIRHLWIDKGGADDLGRAGASRVRASFDLGKQAVELEEIYKSL